MHYITNICDQFTPENPSFGEALTVKMLRFSNNPVSFDSAVGPNYNTNHRLISKGRYETGDSQTAATIKRYIGSESNAIWEEERCQATAGMAFPAGFTPMSFRGIPSEAA